MAEVLGLVLMMAGGLLMLTALRGIALFSPKRRKAGQPVSGEGFKAMLGLMLLLGGLLVAAGYLLAT